MNHSFGSTSPILMVQPSVHTPWAPSHESHTCWICLRTFLSEAASTQETSARDEGVDASSSAQMEQSPAPVQSPPETLTESKKNESLGAEASGAGTPGEAEGSSGGASKSGVKKDAKAAKKAERLAARQQGQAAASKEEEDPLAANYGDLPLIQSVEISGRKWTPIGQLEPSLVAPAGSEASAPLLLLRGRIHTSRGKGKMAFLVLREAGCTVQCVMSVGEHVSKGMVKFATGLSKESIVDVEGVVVVPEQPIDATTQQQVEIQVRKVYCVSKGAAVLPINLEDAARSEQEIEQGEKEGKQYARVLQDTRLNNRTLELRIPSNQAIFSLQSAVGQLFREFLYSRGFKEIHTPKLTPGSSEGGAAVFHLDYKGRPACLAQSPQLYKQMAVLADFGKVFEIGPVFRAENAFTHRHLCEFTGLDFEMEIKEHYFEVLEVVEQLFLAIFEGLNTRWKTELAAVQLQYPFEPLKYSKETLRISFAEGVAMLRGAGHEVADLEDLNTEMERTLGGLVKAKYDTDFYIMYRFPTAARAFYSMPAKDDPNYCNSFDVFIRGEEILSGAQRIHEPELLTRRATECGIDVATISSYIDSFRPGLESGGIR
eukprot:TRINITY_DN3579_c0_g1_i13.p1 TRINITY_DN3579_c0_g1~~TRINITY_DN3579_c0_g1_i13.p1  ORF type:complete len:600 (+),score=130.84 TRINITY_DN3579_c0_g1_i13:2-1801(+)